MMSLVFSGPLFCTNRFSVPVYHSQASAVSAVFGFILEYLGVALFIEKIAYRKQHAATLPDQQCFRSHTEADQ